MTHRNTVQLYNAYKDYTAGTKTTLNDCYGTCSDVKQISLRRCCRICNALKGEDLRIISYNTYTFTVGFIFEHPQNHRKAFCYLTRLYDRFIYLDEIEQREGKQ